MEKKENQLIAMAMEEWLGDCKARLIDKLEQLWHDNESKFPESQLQYHKASMERFMGVPLELFAIMCATEVAKYNGNLCSTSPSVGALGGERSLNAQESGGEMEKKDNQLIAEHLDLLREETKKQDRQSHILELAIAIHQEVKDLRNLVCLFHQQVVRGLLTVDREETDGQ
jgi:hypothetical protein